MTARYDLIAALALALGGFAFAVASRIYKRLDVAPAGLGFTVSVGVVTGATAVALNGFAPRILREGIPLAVLLLAAAWIRRRDAELDGSDALVTGSIAGLTAAAVASPVSADPLGEILRFGSAGPIALAAAWFGVTRFAPLLAWGLGAAALGGVAVASRNLEVTIGAAAVVAAAPAIVAIISVLRLRAVVVTELAEESSLGVFDEAEIASVAHPLQRVKFGVWPDRQARRRFVQLATEIALRKHQQRRMKPAAARLYQLEILKLRMELQAVEEVHRSVVRQLENGGADEFDAEERDAMWSDTMADRR